MSDSIKNVEEKNGVDSTDESSGFNFNFEKSDDPHAGITDESLNSLREKSDRYEIDKGDITKTSNKSIFRLITTRYFKTAYPVLVEEDK